MMNEMSVSEVRKRLPSLLNEISETNIGITITRHGKAIARIQGIKKEVGDKYPLRNLSFCISKDFDEDLSDRWEALKG